MLLSPEIIALNEAVEAHARAIVAGDTSAAEAAVAARALEGYRTAIAGALAQGPFDRFAVVARARIGPQYVVKVRLSGARGSALTQVRWGAAEDGRWLIAELEYLTPDNMPWSRVGPPRPVAVEKRNG